MARKDKSTPTQLGLEIDLETPGQAAVKASLFPEDGPAPEAAIAPAAPKPAPGDGRSRLAALVAAATSAEGLARGQSFGQAETVVIGRPSPQVGFRSHTGPAWSGTFYVLENRTKVAHGGKAMVRSHFLVEGTVAAEFVTRRDSAIKAKRLTPWIDSMGNLGLWAQSVSGQGENAWIDSGRAAIVAAQRTWLRVSADQVASRYRAFQYPGMTCEPRWPEWAADPLEILERAFGQDGIIWDTAHPALQGLDGAEIKLGGEEVV